MGWLAMEIQQDLRERRKNLWDLLTGKIVGLFVDSYPLQCKPGYLYGLVWVVDNNPRYVFLSHSMLFDSPEATWKFRYSLNNITKRWKCYTGHIKLSLNQRNDGKNRVLGVTLGFPYHVKAGDFQPKDSRKCVDEAMRTSFKTGIKSYLDKEVSQRSSLWVHRSETYIGVEPAKKGYRVRRVWVVLPWPS